MTRVGGDAADLIVAIMQGVARSLGEPGELQVLQDDRLDQPHIAAEVAAAAAYHALLPLVWEAVERNGAPAALRSAVHDAYLPLVARSLKLRHLLHAVDAALSDAEIPYAVYKGPAVARYYRSTEQRVFADIDVLVARHDIARVDASLNDAGFVGGWVGVPPEYAETGYYLGGFGSLDLHWHVMREAAVRRAFRIETVDMLARTTRDDDIGASTFDVVDDLIAVATHACFDGAYRLGWFVDVGRLLRAPDLDVVELRRRCTDTSTGLVVQAIIDRTQRALDVATLSPPLAWGGWRRALDAISAARPVERTFRQVGRGGLAFRATRSTTGASLAALASITVSEGLLPLVTQRQHRWRIVRNNRS